jgi:hypothetical protein
MTLCIQSIQALKTSSGVVGATSLIIKSDFRGNDWFLIFVVELEGRNTEEK